mmetsp:Transcript_26833/g.37447  ORF Transcript_26833/g.37447 Transcript_26833/m.37447 type:complete len:247 (-) Transcript_26833:83-823(-)
MPFSKEAIASMPSSVSPLSRAINKTSANSMMTKKTQIVRKHSCLECGKSFFKKHHLAAHNLTHTGALPFQCANCSKRFRQLCHLGQHQIKHAGGQPPFSCTNCTKSFWHHTNLVNHQRTYHCGQRPFRCDVCNSAFTQKMVLKRHFLTHRYEKPFSCISCKKGFIQKINVYYHIRKAKALTRQSSNGSNFETSFCDNCKIDFSSADHLIRHIALEHRHEEKRAVVRFACRKSPQFQFFNDDLIYGM